MIGFIIFILVTALFGIGCWAVAQGNGDDNEFLQRYEYERKRKEEEKEKEEGHGD